MTTRRTLLCGLAAGVAGSVATGSAAGAHLAGRNSGVDEGTVTVRVYPDGRYGWSKSTLRVAADVETAMERIAARVDGTLDRSVTAAVTREPPLSSDHLSYDSVSDAIETTRLAVAARGETGEPVCHLLLARASVNRTIGYGYAGGQVRVGADRPGAICLANVGATELWDGPRVSANMAVQEVLHAYLTPGITRAVVGSNCEHHLGAIRAPAPDRRVVTPMATAYADDTRVGGETRWHGTGCGDPDRLSRRDETTDDAAWEHTLDPSAATIEATTLYVARYL
ncbi:hypothetical protein BRD17_06760 [Halobacteriales archaeon SW_7_68_16]|nr:MAG: hypothetical protein BRD17_06760 [Halobacteriales archaeon SW_7_68_16]